MFSRDVSQLFRYEEILLEERTTWLEIQALEKKFDTWSQVTGDTSTTKHTTSKPLASARDITKDLPPEVAAFEVSVLTCRRYDDWFREWSV